MQEKPHFPAATALNFAERIMPEGMARLPRGLAGTNVSRSPSNPITLLDGNASPICEPNYLLYKGWNPTTATKLVKINKGNRLAAAIGLFQRPLIEEIKARDPERAELNMDNPAELQSLQRVPTTQQKVLRNRGKPRERVWVQGHLPSSAQTPGGSKRD